MAWQKGQSGNPVGRKPGCRGMAESMRREIARRTDDGAKLLDFLGEILFGVTADGKPAAAIYTTEDRKWAWDRLAQYGAGKPVESFKIDQTISDQRSSDDDERPLTDAELRVFETMLAREEDARRGVPAPNRGDAQH